MTTTALMPRAQIENLTVDGISVNYAVAGKGPAVLLVHGLASSLITWCCNIDALADAGFTAIAIDLPGYGDSGLPTHLDYTPDSGARFLGDFTGRLGLDRFSIVGSSAGGLIAGLTALKYPDRVEKVALVGSAGLGRQLSWPLRLISIPVVGELIYQPRMFGKAAVARRLFYRPPDVLDAIYPELLRVKCLPHAPYVMLRSVRSGVTLMGLRPDLNMLDRLRGLQAPLLTVWGEDDAIIPAAQAEDVRRALPGSAVHTLPQCGHWPHMEKPDQFNQILTAFLSQPAPTPPSSAPNSRTPH